MIFGLEIFAFDVFAKADKVGEVIWSWEEICPIPGEWSELVTPVNTYQPIAVPTGAWVAVTRTYDDEYFSVSEQQSTWTEVPPESPNTIRRC